jgi:hypothetical protein
LCARLKAPKTGRVMEVWSTEPALQFYTGLLPLKTLPGGPGKSGQAYFPQHGLCFEPQGYPNAPNFPAFPSAVYLPGQPRAGRELWSPRRPPKKPGAVCIYTRRPRKISFIAAKPSEPLWLGCQPGAVLLLPPQVRFGTLRSIFIFPGRP